jgi:radical SAM superfamily enzyme YgiQ (UPF0313 family)
MIILLHPRTVRPQNRRLPLSILSIASMLEGKEEYTIVDGNLDVNPAATLDRLAAYQPIEMLAVSVMPGPQMKAAIPLTKEFRRKYPKVPIVWGGYFPSMYAAATLNTDYVDFAVRGQGEDTFPELLAALRGQGNFAAIPGLSWRRDGVRVDNPPRPLRSLEAFPALPYHRLGDVSKYLLPTYLGRRTAVHHASIGCPYRCQFCGVVPVYDGRQKTEPARRTAEALGFLQRTYGADSVQFYDNNFFLNESHARDQAEQLIPLKMRWWAEGRVDALLRYSDATLTLLRRSGATMIFLGAESGSNEALVQMNKKITSEQTLELAERLRKFDITPEFSFVIGNPANPERDTRDTIAFIRRIKKLNPAAEIIVQHYIPTPHPDGMYGLNEGAIRFPETPDEWATDRWYRFTTRVDPRLPWLPRHIKRRIDNFELVIASRWPTMQDIHIPAWGRRLLSGLAAWRYSLGVYGMPLELEWAQKLVSLRKPRLESL